MLRYAITPATLNFNNIDSYFYQLEALGANMVLYRDKTNPNYAKDALTFANAFKKSNIEKLFIHQNISLAKALGANGVHLNSSQIPLVKEAKDKGLLVIVSTHNLKEAKLSQDLGANFITLSPLFKSPNKGEPLGIDRFKEIVENLNIPVIALGGIVDEKSIELALESGASGFASIRYFA